MNDSPRKPKVFRLSPDQDEPRTGAQGRAESHNRPGLQQEPEKPSGKTRKPRALPAPEIVFEDDQPDERFCLPLPVTTPCRSASSGVAILRVRRTRPGKPVGGPDCDAAHRGPVCPHSGAGLDRHRPARPRAACRPCHHRPRAGRAVAREKLGTTQADAARAISADDAKAAEATLSDLRSIYEAAPTCAGGMAQLKRASAGHHGPCRPYQAGRARPDEYRWMTKPTASLPALQGG